LELQQRHQYVFVPPVIDDFGRESPARGTIGMGNPEDSISTRSTPYFVAIGGAGNFGVCLPTSSGPAPRTKVTAFKWFDSDAHDPSPRSRLQN